jgi:hypothetical protein
MFSLNGTKNEIEANVVEKNIYRLNEIKLLKARNINKRDPLCY